MTGLFKGKSGGFFGTARAEEVERLVEEIIKKGGREKGIVFGVFKNDEGAAPYSLACIVAEEQDAKPSGARSRRIASDDDDEQGEDTGDM
jgi:hypothetical protein